tara:strand:- start:42 stop:1814 length:1773 start_codon:yes stop_codon:yes gene_type:complete
MSNVFRQIKSNDVHQRPFKAYKHYTLLSSDIGDGGITQSAIYFNGRIDQDGAILYPTNPDGTNMYVAWHAVKQKFYDDRPTALPEHVLNPLNKRSLFVSASTLTIPYNDVGERIKNNTFVVTSSIGTMEIGLRDDGNGNLIDTAIDTTTFASSSRNFFYMSFNDEYKFYKEYNTSNLGKYSGSFSYELAGRKLPASHFGDAFIVPGVDVTSSIEPKTATGLAVQFQDAIASGIRIPHNDMFNRFGRCDDWTISFWAKNTNSGTSTDVILSKHSLKTKLYYNTEDNRFETQDTFIEGLTETAVSGSGVRIPFHLTLASAGGGVGTQTLFFEAYDGTHHVTNDMVPGVKSVFNAQIVPQNVWCHWAVRNSGSLLEIFCNGTANGGFSGSLPPHPTANDSDITIGSRTKEFNESKNIDLAEFRMYDYAVSNDGIQSLANNHYLSASCYQTNIAGNVFHRNGAAIVSSVLPKYHSGSGVFSSDYTWNAKWRGTHTIYENQVFVRVPKDILNVSINPTATYTPPTTGDTGCDAKQSNLLPGERRKDGFVSGTLKPYVTTVGLYNDEGQMLAVGKLAQPIQKRDDIDMNFVIRWDY